MLELAACGPREKRRAEWECEGTGAASWDCDAVQAAFEGLRWVRACNVGALITFIN